MSFVSCAPRCRLGVLCRMSWNGWGWQGSGWSQKDWKSASSGSASKKPYWRRFVDASEDPTVIHWCRQRVQQFLDSGNSQENVEWLGNETCPSQSDIFFSSKPCFIWTPSCSGRFIDIVHLPFPEEYRNTIRSLAPEMGVAWLKVSKGVYAARMHQFQLRGTCPSWSG